MADDLRFDSKDRETQPDEMGYPKMGIGRYIATRIPTLKPPMHKAPNPIRLLTLLNFQQWLFFLVGFIAWTWDAFDFFTVSLTVEDLAEEFDVPNSKITWGITAVLMLRSVGSITFGESRAERNPRVLRSQCWTLPNMAYERRNANVCPIIGLAADRWGRKWPFVVNNVLFIIFELATGFCNTYHQFLGVRAYAHVPPLL